MLLLRLLNNNFLIGSTILILTMMSQIVNGKPQDPDIFGNMAIKGLVMAGNMAEMMGNAGMISKQMSFELPFAKTNSKTEIGTGAAFRNDYDSSEEDKRRRKKRSLTLPYDLVNEESLQVFKHLHRGKRSPCFFGMGGTGGTGGTGGDGGAGGSDAERRRRANAQKIAARKKAANAKATKNKTTTPATSSRREQKDLENNDTEEKLTRRKRQTELDDLNQNMANVSNDFQQQAQQISEKIRNFFEDFMKSMNEMAQRLKQHFGAQSSTNTEEI